MKFKIKKSQIPNRTAWLEEISGSLSEVSLAQVEMFRRVNQILEKMDRMDNKSPQITGAASAAGAPDIAETLNELKRKIDRLDIKVSTLAALDASLKSINENLIRLGSVDQKLTVVDSKLATLIYKTDNS